MPSMHFVADGLSRLTQRVGRSNRRASSLPWIALRHIDLAGRGEVSEPGAIGGHRGRLHKPRYDCLDAGAE
jgi:hypothetical protein